MNNQESLIEVIRTRGLSQQDIDELIGIVGDRCRHNTKARLRSILTYGPSTIPDYGIMKRLMFTKGRWEYVAGQCYTSEIKTVRECILKG